MCCSQAKQSVWQQREVGGSIFSSPCISQHPHHLCVASLAGKLLSLQPVSSTYAGFCVNFNKITYKNIYLKKNSRPQEMSYGVWS